MQDDDERLARLLKEAGGRDATALLAEALEAEASWPGGGQGARLMARAKAAIGCGPPSLARLVVRAIGEVIEVLAGDARPGEVLPPLPVRGEARGGVLIRQRLGHRDLVTHIDVRERERFAVILDLGGDAAARRTRVALFRAGPGDEREVMSEVLRQGRVLLPELAAGHWRIEVRDREGWVGALDLSLDNRAA